VLARSKTKEEENKATTKLSNFIHSKIVCNEKKTAGAKLERHR